MFPRIFSRRSLFASGALVLSVAIAGNAIAAQPAMQLTHKPTDLISQSDIRRSPEGYRLQVPGVGEVYLKDLKAPRAGKKCQLSRSALVEAIAAKPPVLHEPTWYEFSIYHWPDGTTFCFPPFGGGCYAMVKKKAP